jgi:hypothetical protein
MATWTDYEKRVWTFDDGKLDFDTWIKDDAVREQKWHEAVIIHGVWREANPDADPRSDDQSDCGKINSEWIEYANALHTA